VNEVSKESQALTLIMFTLISIGVIMSYSASAVFADQVFKSPTYFLRRELFYVVFGMFVFFFTSSLDPEFLKRHSRSLVLFGMLLLVLVFMPLIGHSAGGARRWIRLPLFTFQPVEFVKLVICVYFADYLTRKAKPISGGSLSVFLPPTFILLVILGLVILQPDLGSCIFLFLLMVVLYFLSGIRARYILIAAVVGAVVLAGFILSAPYRMRRVTAYLDPWKDPRGSGFQIIQSFLAFGLGGWKGVGLGQGTQKLFYLPQSYTDFIFSIIGEELGLIGTLSIVVLYGGFFFFGNRISAKARDPFLRMMAFALVLLIILQALINFAVALGMVPTKGLPLPFISYGGTALIFHMAAVGMLVAIDRKSKLVART